MFIRYPITSLLLILHFYHFRIILIFSSNVHKLTLLNFIFVLMVVDAVVVNTMDATTSYKAIVLWPNIGC